jgi:glycosyltransferase involved in cell wall biosynthesis
MNIYFIGQKGIPAQGGGVERHVEELASRLAASGQRVFAYTRQRYTRSDAQFHRGIRILYTPAIYTKHLEAISHTLFSVLDLIRRDADIVHVHSIGPSLLIPLIRLLKPRAKIISTIHSPDYFHQKWNALARLSLRLGERIAATWSHVPLTVSKTLQKHLQERYGIKAQYIPNGVKLPALNADTADLSQWGLQPNGYILAVSRLVRHKGLHFLIDAYQALKTDKKLVIVGGAEYTDDYVKELHVRAAGNANIVFTGKLSGKPLHTLFTHAYLFVHPSLSEGLSIALLEALAYEQAVLASDIPENTEVLEQIGFVFANGDTRDLANRLNFLLKHPQIVQPMKALGREHVSAHYNWDEITETTLQVYRKVLPQPSKALHAAAKHSLT